MKKMQFQIAGISPNTTRTLTIPDYNINVVGTGNNQSAGTGCTIISKTASILHLKVVAVILLYMIK